MPCSPLSGRTSTAPGYQPPPRPADASWPDSGARPARQLAPPAAQAAGTASPWPLQSFLKLAARPAAVPCARLHTRQVLRQWQLGHLADDAELLASELLANAVQASRPPVGTGLIALRLLADHEQLVIEAWDQNPGHPQPCPAGAHAESGRGLAVIEALSHQWGSRRVSASFKAVWCQLLTRSGQPSTEPPPARPGEKRSGG